MGNGKDGRVKRIAKRIIESLREIPIDVSVKAGLQVDLIPKPVIKFFINIHLLNKTSSKKRRGKQNGHREENNKRLHYNDEGASKRNQT